MPDVDLSGSPSDDVTTTPLRGYLARPSGDGPWPGVVMIHEVYGLDDIMRRQAERLASAGFLTLALDLYSDGGARRCLISIMRASLKGEGKPFGDIERGRAWLAESSECSGKIGLIGFCMGGNFALLSATAGFDAVAANYGQVPRHAESVFDGACPIVASYGRHDWTLRGAATKLEQALKRAGVVHDVKEYPDAGHSFLNDADAGPRVLQPLQRVLGVKPEPASAADAWRRIDAFFHGHLD
ncbi:MAG TPA: dienelactone hydrolase family protein [Acidimicrobiales bacterium]|nr:dienelactone hydrolase family protein [Acidimicrobiales bacterium]